MGAVLVPKITFFPGNRTIEYEATELAWKRESRPGSILPGSILDVALRHGIDLRHLCGGVCACITCHVIVKDGDRHLSPMELDEEDRIYRLPDYTLHSRLACRAVPSGDVTVWIPGKDDSGK
jgi:ferredoxin, 2Fe-2S